MSRTWLTEPRTAFFALWLLAAGLAVATTLGFLGGTWWRFELLAHFRLQYLLIASLFLVLFAIGRRWRGVGFALAVTIVNAFCVVPLFVGPDPSPLSRATTKPTTWRFVMANVNSRNSEYDEFLALVQREQPDVVLVMELSPGWLDALAVLANDYPHHIYRDRSDNFGIGVWSRRPWVRASILEIGPVPSIEIEFVRDDRSWHLFFTHPLPPVSRRNAELRDQQLIGFAQLAKKRGPATLLLGDFNTTPWSPIFHAVCETGGLHDPGLGLQPSWPMPLPWPLRIPIDHGLAGDGIRILDRRLGPHIGSDHLPIILDAEI